MHHRVAAAFCNVTFNVTADRVPIHHPVMMMCSWYIGPPCVLSIPHKEGQDRMTETFVKIFVDPKAQGPLILVI